MFLDKWKWIISQKYTWPSLTAHWLVYWIKIKQRRCLSLLVQSEHYGINEHSRICIQECVTCRMLTLLNKEPIFASPCKVIGFYGWSFFTVCLQFVLKVQWEKKIQLFIFQHGSPYWINLTGTVQDLYKSLYVFVSGRARVFLWDGEWGGRRLWKSDK